MYLCIFKYTYTHIHVYIYIYVYVSAPVTRKHTEIPEIRNSEKGLIPPPRPPTEFVLSDI